MTDFSSLLAQAAAFAKPPVSNVHVGASFSPHLDGASAQEAARFQYALGHDSFNWYLDQVLSERIVNERDIAKRHRTPTFRRDNNRQLQIASC